MKDAKGLKESISRTLKITPRGLEESQRKEKNNIVYFGNKDINEDGDYNDVFITETESGLGPKHFKIFHRSDENEYYLQDLEQGTGTFIKINHWHVIYIYYSLCKMVKYSLLVRII